MIKLYGITNCNTVKKARLWFKEQNIDVEFIDFKKIPPNKQDIKFWLTQIPREILINRKGTTWRKITETEQQQALLDNDFAIKIMQEHPSIIKRPILVFNQTVSVGFDEKNYLTLFINFLKK